MWHRYGSGAPFELTDSDPARDLIGDAEHAPGNLFGDLVAIGALGGQVGPHMAARRVIHAKVDVERQGADSIVELA